MNFGNLWTAFFYEPGDRAKNRIEFRQHVGTLDYAEIVSCISFLVAFVNFGHTASDAEFVALLLRATDLDLTATDVNRAIGCGEEVVDHYDFSREPEVIGMLPQGHRCNGGLTTSSTS